VISEEVVKAAAGNSWSGEAIIKLLLEQRGPDVVITKEVVKAAVGNSWSGEAVMKLLLEQRGPDVVISEEVVEIIAGKFGQWTGRVVATPESKRDDRLQHYPDLVQIVDRTVRQAYGEDPILDRNKEVSIEIAWQLQQCIRDELEGNPELSSVLTITGNASHSRAATCLEYVQATWGSFGVQVLGELEGCLRNRFEATGTGERNGM
jgi:hypothetical protein